ncbi:MAG TPA: hypothetical protein VK752_13085 [Bryobacteraceae bacterium]|jgi:uncharacterized protein (TIGR03437 family)|nr:hypothetical protein [Bryobacteraceae bacterium]
MSRTWGIFAACLVIAAGARAQCYQFTSTGPTLQVNISSFVVQSGPNLINGNYESIYSFESTNTLISAGGTQTSQSTLTPYKLGGASLLGGPTAATEFTLTVGANNNALSNDSWIVTLTTTANVIPTGVLPQPSAFPPASAWVVPQEAQIYTAYLTVFLSGSGTNYLITSIGACAATTGTGTGTGSANGGPVITSVNTSGAAAAAGIAQNSWTEIHGTGLVPAATTAAGVLWNSASSFLQGQMPTQLNGVSATVNGKAAYIYFYCSAATDPACATDQINVLTPLDSTIGNVSIVVTSSGSSTPPFTVSMHSGVPSFLLFSKGYIAATHLNYNLIGPATLYPGASTPAAPGESIVTYATGFGLPATALTAGSATQTGALPSVPVCTIGGAPALVGFAGLISPGLYQLNITVPSNAAAGDDAISCAYSGSTTPSGDLVTVN